MSVRERTPDEPRALAAAAGTRPGATTRRGRHISRLEAFSDAVFGFAATLVVVSLEVPTTFSELQANLFGFIPFALSFAMLVFLWAVHNGFFRRYGLNDAYTLAVNSVFLFLVLFYVYPLKFMATAVSLLYVGGPTGRAQVSAMLPGYDQFSQLLLIYGGGFVAMFLCILLLYRHAYVLGDALGLTELERFDARTHMRHYSIYVVVGLLSMALAWQDIGMSIGLPGWIYAFLGPICYAHGAARDRQRKALERALADEASGRSSAGSPAVAF